MATRPTLELELQPLLKALRVRLDALSGVTMDMRDGLEVHTRTATPFLQLEIRRDHMNLDLWLPPDKLEEARASGIARAHPFMELEAVRVRFERAEDLTKVAHWLEEAYHHAAQRAKKAARQAAAAARAAQKGDGKNGSAKKAKKSRPSPAAGARRRAKSSTAARSSTRR